MNNIISFPKTKRTHSFVDNTIDELEHLYRRLHRNYSHIPCAIKSLFALNILQWTKHQSIAGKFYYAPGPHVVRRLDNTCDEFILVDMVLHIILHDKKGV